MVSDIDHSVPSLDATTDAPLELGSYRSLISLAVPAIIASTGNAVMQFIDGLLLSRYSQTAMAAQGSAGIMAWAAMLLFVGTAAYADAFVAQYQGAGRRHRVAEVVWQALWFSLACGLILAVVASPLSLLFAYVGHDPTLVTGEQLYFKIILWGGVFPIAFAALAGFFLGRGDNRTLMVVELIAQVLNGVLDWLLIYGPGPFPEWGLAGAAIATVAAQAVGVAVALVIFLSRRHRRTYGSWRGRRLDLSLMGRLMRYGLPNGIRGMVEVFGWAAFMQVVGRLGVEELSVTNISWRLSGLVFPLWGISLAVTTQVGQAQGRGEPDLAALATWRGLSIAQVAMMLGAGVLVAWSEPMLRIFMPSDMSPAEVARTISTGVVLLRFIAAYCLVDAINLIMMGALAGAGDTKAMLAISTILFSGFVAAMLIMAYVGASLYALWAALTIQVALMAAAFLGRFLTGHWRSMRVIEQTLQD